uniref:Mitochondrial import inner membrane translocase subunit TIM50 n=4 Tax=Euarchontoglires TaxID=314146 RepID=G1U255_RABIT
MMRTQCLLGLRTFVAFAAKLWSFFIYLLRRQIRTVIQYQTVRYDILPLSPVSRNRLAQVKRKILVLDLDETLIHSHHDGVLRPTVRPGTPPDFILKVVIDKHPVRFFVHKRPHVDFFLEVVSQWYELVVFTASMEIYGSAVADKLDNSRSILKRRYYRQTMPSPSNPGSVTPATQPFSTCSQCWMPSGEGRGLQTVGFPGKEAVGEPERAYKVCFSIWTQDFLFIPQLVTFSLWVLGRWNPPPLEKLMANSVPHLQ